MGDEPARAASVISELKSTSALTLFKLEFLWGKRSYCRGLIPIPHTPTHPHRMSARVVPLASTAVFPPLGFTSSSLYPWGTHPPYSFLVNNLYQRFGAERASNVHFIPLLSASRVDRTPPDVWVYYRLSLYMKLSVFAETVCCSISQPADN